MAEAIRAREMRQPQGLRAKPGPGSFLSHTETLPPPAREGATDDTDVTVAAPCLIDF